VVPLLAAATQLGGHSLVLLRAVPALFAGAGAYVTCRLVAEFGGGRFAQALAAIVFVFTGVLASFGVMAGPDEVGLWTWPLIALLIVRIVKGADPRWWLAVGGAAGLSLESKYSVLSSSRRSSPECCSRRRAGSWPTAGLRPHAA
jgi:4-amino-4-deoxy-L-arabinose transferase-like glycosyltransferase